MGRYLKGGVHYVEFSMSINDILSKGRVFHTMLKYTYQTDKYDNPNVVRFCEKFTQSRGKIAYKIHFMDGNIVKLNKICKPNVFHGLIIYCKDNATAVQPPIKSICERLKRVKGSNECKERKLIEK